MTNSIVCVNRSGDTILIRVRGRATAAFGPALRETLLASQESGSRCVLFDLSECLYMDSTFIGVLAMAAADGRTTSTRVLIANAGPVPRRHLASLGVDTLFAYADVVLPEGPWEPLAGTPSGAGSLKSLGQTILEAHEALGVANPDNVPRFQDVVACLRQEARERKE